MPYPDKPQILTSYTAAEQALGDGSLPGQELDVDLANIKTSVEALIDFIKTSIRSDGKLANGSVTSDALSASIRLGFNPPAPWSTGKAYTTVDTVFQGFGFYLCLAAHTSGVFATDLGSGRWLLLADLTPPGGALIAANNLSDLADTATARANLGLGTMATATAGTGSTQFRNNLQNDGVYQPLDADLTAIAGLTSAANKLPYFSGSGTAALADLTAAGRALIDDADASAQRTTLGLGSLATLSSVTTSEIAAAAIRLSSEGYATPLDTEIATALWVDSRRGGGSWIATTSGAAIDLTGIPAGVKEVYLHFDGVSLAGAVDMSVQLGVSGGIETTGYNGNAFAASGSGTSNTATTSFFQLNLGNASQVLRGTIRFNLMDAATNLWSINGSVYRGSGNDMTAPSGTKALSGALSQIRISSASTFDAGRARLEWII